MIISIEKNKLENLLYTISPIISFDHGEEQALIEVYEQFSKILSKLYMKELNIFGNLRNHSFKETKEYRRAINRSESAEIKAQYLKLLKDSLQEDIETSIEYITDYVSQ